MGKIIAWAIHFIDAHTAVMEIIPLNAPYQPQWTKNTGKLSPAKPNQARHGSLIYSTEQKLTQVAEGGKGGGTIFCGTTVGNEVSIG